jgi:ABC-type lipoprotein export system ATPase subunit
MYTGGGMKINIEKTVEIEKTLRVEMLGSMFDLPIEDKLSVHLSGDVPIEERKWNVGLIVGPSGSGKTLILENLFGKPQNLRFGHSSVVDDFPDKSMESIARVCQSVGFNTVPSWLRPYSVLSNGEKFRVEIANLLLSSDSNGTSPILCDEFTSVVDRQVAQITSHAVGKYVRENELKFVAASCHYDILDWLQPDWILEPGNPLRFQWRELQSRPKINVSIRRIKYEAWELFKNFHYMTPELNKAARCYGLFINNRIASFSAVLYRPHARVSDIMGLSRSVTLPDWQGLGLSCMLTDTIGAAYKAVGKRLHSYPSHPSYVRSRQRSPNWIQIKIAGQFSPRKGNTSTVDGFGGKRCAVFMYTGPSMNIEDAKKLINGE